MPRRWFDFTPWRLPNAAGGPQNDSMESERIERDTMGEVRVPAAALYGAQTARAIANFPISGRRFPRPFLRALGLVKSAAAEVEWRSRLPARRIAQRPSKPRPNEVAEGAHDAQFAVDIFQTGSGTSTNMNANEVIGRLAGAHPNDDVNRGQSSNDVIPSAIHIAAAEAVTDAAAARHGAPRRVAGPQGGRVPRCRSRSAARTCRTPCPCGWARNSAATRARWNAPASAWRPALAGLYELPLGGTAVGTGLNAPPGFAAAVIAEIARTHRPALSRGRQSLRSAGRARRRLFSERRPALVRRGAHQDRQRRPLAGFRPALRPGRNPTARGAARLQHHARQGEPGDRREPADDLRAGDRLRCRPSPGAARPATSNST